MEGESVTEAPSDEPVEEEDGMRPIPDRLLSELTAFRTLGLRHAVGERPDVAFLVLTHALTLQVFYRYALDSCLEIAAKLVTFSSPPAGLADSEVARKLSERHERFTAMLPSEPEALWAAMLEMDEDTLRGLFAHCTALTVNAVQDPWNRRTRAITHADQVAGMRRSRSGRGGLDGHRG